MSTGLFDESELDSDDSDFDWEDFAPEPEDGTVGAYGASEASDDGELDLDDSEFDWEANLHAEDPLSAEESQIRTTRIEAALARMEQTVTGAPGATVDGAPYFEDRASGEGAAGEDAEPELLLVPDTELPASEESSTEFDLNAGTGPEPELMLLDEEAEPDGIPPRISEFDPEPISVHDVREPGRVVIPPRELEPAPDIALPFTFEPAAVYGSEAVYETQPVDEFPAAPTATAALESAVVGDDPSVEPESASSRRQSEPHSRVYTATVVLACSLLVLVAAVLIIRSFERPSTKPAPQHSTRTPAPTSTNSELRQAARIRAATDEVNLATTTALAGVSSLPFLASPTEVAQVVNPYAESLQLYGSFLSGTQVPAQARTATTQVLADAQLDTSFLGTLQGLAPDQLGSYLHSFYVNAAQLQSSLISLENQLPSPSSP